MRKLDPKQTSFMVSVMNIPSILKFSVLACLPLFCSCRSGTVDFVRRSGFVAHASYPWTLEVEADVDLFRPISDSDVTMLIKLQHPALGTDAPLVMWVESHPCPEWVAALGYLVPPWGPPIGLLCLWQEMERRSLEPWQRPRITGWSLGDAGFSREHKLDFRDVDGVGVEDGSDGQWHVNAVVVNYDFQSVEDCVRHVSNDVPLNSTKGSFVLGGDGVYAYVDCNEFRRRYVWLRICTYSVNGVPVPGDSLAPYTSGEVLIPGKGTL